MDTNGATHGFLFSGGSFTILDVPGGFITSASGINDAGQIVGFFRDARGAHGFVANLANCRDQVQVDSFTATTGKGINAEITGDKLTLTTGDKHGNPGIQFLAGITIKNGSIPINAIHIRYIQNLIVSTTAFDYNPNPDLIKVLVPGATFPLLDRVSGPPPPPFYEGDFEETDQASSTRSVYATDSPSVFGPITLTGPSRQLQGVDAFSAFRVYLGCVSDGDPTFQTMATLDWNVLYTGTFNSKQKKFTVGKDAGISAQPSVLDQTIPEQDAPIARDAFIFIESSP
jgi:hypothetical protein